MNLEYRTVGLKRVVLAAAFFGMLAMAGCESQPTSRPVYLSGDARLVGGGLKIEWQAPEPGTVYLVEKRSGKLVQTFTLKAGEMYDFAIESVVDAEELGSMLGIDIAKAQFLLYFKPAGPATAAEPQVK